MQNLKFYCKTCDIVESNMWNGSKIGTEVVDGRNDHFYFMRKLVQGAIESGCGYSGLTTILAMVNIKNMHHKTYSRITKELSIDYGKVSIKIYYNLNF